MNARIITRIITIVLGIVAISTAFLIYNWRQTNVEQWNEQACIAFKKALEEDLHSRSDIDVVYSESPRKTVSLNMKASRNISIISDCGERSYTIDSCKHVNNIMSDTRMRSITTIVLEERPLVPDTINTKWKRLLKKEGIAGPTRVRISVTDLDERTTSKSSTTLETVACDSLLSCYLGYRCEVEVTGFIKYAWLENINIMDGFFISLPLFFAALFCFIGFVFRNKLRAYFVKEVPVIIEKEIPVIVLEETESPVYQLTMECSFYFKECLLKGADESEHLFPQSALLLKAFIEAEDYSLSSEAIMSVLWPDNEGTSDKVHQSVARLRASLAKVSQIKLSRKNYIYSLEIPHSIDKNDVL